jgi:hypothetical protein
MIVGNIIMNWGTVAVTHTGSTFGFPQPYTDGQPAVVIGVNFSGPTGAFIPATSKTGVVIQCRTGASGPVDYHAIGS